MTEITPTLRYTPQKIVVLRALYLGDMLLAIPALRSLRRAFPEAEVTLIGLPWAGNFLARYHYIDRFLEFPGFPGLPEQAIDVVRIREFLQNARTYGYDLAIQMHGNGSISNQFVASLGAKRSVGFTPTSPQNPFLLNDTLVFQPEEHEIHKWLRLAHRVGAKLDDSQLEFPLNTADSAELAALSKEHRMLNEERLIVIHAGSKYATKLWAPQRWTELIDELGQVTAAQIVLTGNADEAPTTSAVAGMANIKITNLAGKTSLGGMAALLKQATLFVGTDSGPAHLAEAMGTKTVRLFGPTDPERWGPLDRQHHGVVSMHTDCSPCSHTECPTDHRCMNDIHVATVKEVALHLLHQAVARS
jgi:lipopolysaccharide heptosyltransferase II